MEDYFNSDLTIDDNNDEREAYKEEKSFDPVSKTKIILSPVVVKGLRSGNHKAFETIFHTFYSRVHAFIKTIIKDNDAAGELAQEVFVDLWEKRENIDPDKNISAYIYTMARNSALSEIKRQKRFEYNEFNYDEEKETTLTDDELIAKETGLLIKLTINAMPPKRRQVYEMSRNEEMSNDEIAKKLNISKKVVEKHLRLAINEIREVLRVMLMIFFH